LASLTANGLAFKPVDPAPGIETGKLPVTPSRELGAGAEQPLVRKAVSSK
jgi:hypothetical protein